MTGHVTLRTKAHARARYRRRYARHRPVVVARRIDYGPPPRIPRLMIGGFVQFMGLVVAVQFGAKGKWGRGKYQHATKSGPGRRPVARMDRIRPTGSKMLRRFIRDARGENVAYRKQYLAMTGKSHA